MWHARMAPCLWRKRFETSAFSHAFCTLTLQAHRARLSAKDVEFSSCIRRYVLSNPSFHHHLTLSLITHRTHTHAQGAQNVRCARCSHVTSVPPTPTPAPTPAPTQDLAQLHCTQCRTLLMYPRGAQQVQCSLCGNLNDATQSNQLGHIVCVGCQMTLMYAHGAQSVKCAVCNHVTPVALQSRPPPAPVGTHQHQRPPSYPPHPHAPATTMGPPSYAGGGPLPGPGPTDSHQQQQHQQQTSSSSKNPVQAVLVEHPPSLDEGGNEVQPMQLGVAKTDS